MKDALALDSLDTCTPSDRIPCAWEVGPPGMRQGFGGKLSYSVESGHRRGLATPGSHTDMDGRISLPGTFQSTMAGIGQAEFQANDPRHLVVSRLAYIGGVDLCIHGWTGWTGWT